MAPGLRGPGGPERPDLAAAGQHPLLPRLGLRPRHLRRSLEAVLTDAFETGRIPFTASTDDPKSPVKNRTFSSFQQAAEEDANSRLWDGMHYRWDAVDGLQPGRNVGTYVVQHELQPF